MFDIGTAQGGVLVEIAMAHPHLTGGGFDLPNVQLAFEAYVAEHGLNSRLVFQPGNFFEDSLPYADVFVMGRILHDWDIPSRKLLLAKAYATLPRGGELVVHETFIDNARRDRAHSLLASLNMLIQTDGGSEFTEEECMTWMREVGFDETYLVPLAAKHTAVVGKKRTGPTRALS